MKNKSKKSIIWKIAVLAAIAAVICLAAAACGNAATKEVSEPISTAATTEIAEVTAETTESTAETTETTSSVTTTTTKATTSKTTADPKTTATKSTKTAKAAEPAAEKKTAAAPKQNTSAPKKTTAKPQQTPVKTTAAKKGHYETVHHDAVIEDVWVVDIPAGSQIDPDLNCKMHTVYECYCGQRFSSYDEYDAHSDYYSIGTSEEIFKQHCGYWFWYVSDEDYGHYEKDIVKNEYDEQVWVED